MSDNFERTVTGGWGTFSASAVWSMPRFRYGDMVRYMGTPDYGPMMVICRSRAHSGWDCLPVNEPNPRLMWFGDSVLEPLP